MSAGDADVQAVSTAHIIRFALTHEMHEVEESKEHLVLHLQLRRVHAAARPVVLTDTRAPDLNATNQ